MHCVDLDESFQTHIYLQNLASIQPRTSPVKLAHGRPGPGPEEVGSPRMAARDTVGVDFSAQNQSSDA